MLTLILILIAIASVLLTLVVLIQNPKGGIAANFISPTQVMGAKRSTDVVEKATWVLAIVLISLSLMSNFFIPTANSGESTNDSRIKDDLENVSVPAAPQQQPMPGAEQQQQQAGDQPQEQPAP